MTKKHFSLPLLLAVLLFPSFLNAAADAKNKSVSETFGLDLNNPLPNWVDSSREKTKDERAIRAVPQAVTPADFRIPAEYEPIGAVVLGWAGYSQMLNGIAKAASSAGAQIWAVGGPSSISGVANYTPISLRIDTVWVRDYGPFGISSKSNTLGIVDAVYRHYQYRVYDDALPQNLGRTANINVYGMNIILDGGNLMVDSYGNLYMTERTYLWNSRYSKDQVNTALKTALRVKNVYTFEYAGYPGEPSDGTGHIDMFMKLLNDNTVLIALSDDEPFKSNSEKALKFFKGKTAPNGKPYKIVTAKGWVDGGAWYTYTNSLIVNGTVIMPSYSGHSAEEKEAISAYKAGISGVKVVPVNSDNSIVAGGSIHCVTQSIPAVSGRSINFTDYTQGVEYTPTELTLPDNPVVNQLLQVAK